MPVYLWHCYHCGHEFSLFKQYKDQNVDCVACGSSGLETFVDKDGDKHWKVERQFCRINIISSIENTEGRVGEPVDMSMALGPEGKNITSRRALRELKDKIREKTFLATDGPKTVMKEFVDAGSGKVYREKVTNNVTGFDMGELHRAEETPESNEIQSAFVPGETLAKTESDLAKRISS